MMKLHPLDYDPQRERQQMIIFGDRIDWYFGDCSKCHAPVKYPGGEASFCEVCGWVRNDRIKDKYKKWRKQ